MSTLITTNIGGTCGICREDFEKGEEQFTHVGATHDAFDENCFKLHLNNNPYCPYDRKKIDLGHLRIPMRERLTKIFAPIASTALLSSIILVVLGQMEQALLPNASSPGLLFGSLTVLMLSIVLMERANLAHIGHGMLWGIFISICVSNLKDNTSLIDYVILNALITAMTTGIFTL